MRIVVGALWLVLFLVLFAFAVNNTGITDLRFFAGMSVKAPLIALLLAFFIAGFTFGFVALMPTWVRQRVELRRLRRLSSRAVETVPGQGSRGATSTPMSMLPTAQSDPADAIQSVARGARTTT